MIVSPRLHFSYVTLINLIKKKGSVNPILDFGFWIFNL